MTIEEFAKDKQAYYKQYYKECPWAQSPEQKKKRPKVTKANSCTKCIYFTDAGDKTYCSYYKKYKRGRRGCAHRTLAESRPVSRSEKI